MISLGIESTAHTFSVGIVDEERIYSNERVIFKTEKGGIHPREAAELHSREAINILNRAVWKAGFVYKKVNDKLFIVDALNEIKNKFKNLKEGFNEEPWNRYRYLESENGIKVWIEENKVRSDDKKLEDELDNYINGLKEFERKIDLVSFAAGPGLYPTLVQGKFLANLLSIKFNLPRIGVNHLIAHVEIVKFYNKFEDPVVLLVTGANTMVLALEGNKYRIFGETLDMGVGNFLDKVARLMGLGFPGGPKIQELARNGRNLIKLPYTVKGMDIQLGGLYTHIKRLIESKKYSYEDIAYSIQEYVFSMLAEISERAIAHLNKKEFGLTGGVALNERLREILKSMCDERKVKFGTVQIDLGSDNGAMIAYTGLVWFKMGIEGKDSIDPYWRPEQVEYKVTK
ncbi:tRNA (adenosine(37)-N6)-threonylcarbamoyltransferase complex transferase subunit TsaD [Nanoarchaeota archaeon NZ13-N]|nr:MAG: tRNA (adenosine(37)-N6)-threonylcarbamoyltransferase complex transferase subunit TsaD [Nanoarchaeota archaeon NZ13-N]